MIISEWLRPQLSKGAAQQDLNPNSGNFYLCSLPIADNVLYEKFLNGLNACSKWANL